MAGRHVMFGVCPCCGLQMFCECRRKGRNASCAQIYVYRKLLHGGGEIAIAGLVQLHQTQQPFFIGCQRTQAQFQRIIDQDFPLIVNRDVYRVDAAMAFCRVVLAHAQLIEQCVAGLVEHFDILSGIHMPVKVYPLGQDGQADGKEGRWRRGHVRMDIHSYLGATGDRTES